MKLVGYIFLLIGVVMMVIENSPIDRINACLVMLASNTFLLKAEINDLFQLLNAQEKKEDEQALKGDDSENT